MRKHFAPTPPSEDVRSIKRVSLEEELIIVEQANQSASTAENCLSETERLVDLAGALEDLAVIADGIEQPTATELDLIDRCAQMAVAGTDVAPDELLQGPPLAIGQQIATEGWKDTAEKIWKTIKAFMVKIWEAIDKFFKVHVILPTIYARLELVLKQLKNRTAKLKYGAKPEMEIETGLQYFSNGQRLQRNTNEFATELAKFGKAVDLVYIANPLRVRNIGAELSDIINNWEPKTTDDTLEKMRKTLAAGQRSTSLPLSLPFSTKEGEFKAQTSYEVLGACYFKLMTFEDSSSTPPLTAVDRLRHAGLTMLDGEEPKDDSITFKHGNAAVYEKIIGEMRDMLQVISQFNSNKGLGTLPDLRKCKKSLEQASEEAIKDTVSEESDPIEASFIRTMLNFNPTFARWVQQPAVPFYTKVIGVARTVIMLVSHYNSLYEVENKETEAKLMGEMKAA